jgi:C4-dicarboxylate-specific signal transduction histidine kinase
MSDLQHVNRVATASELAASIAHEVSQPLAGIVANANAGIRWLGYATPDISRAVATFKQIVDAGHHASEVITSVRALFARRAEERLKVDINRLVRNAISLERRDIERHGVSLSVRLKSSGVIGISCVSRKRSDSRGDRRCGRMRTDRNTIVIT